MTRALKPAIAIQLRDLALLRGLLESRVMRLDHAARLYFDDRGEYTKKRVQRLKAAGLISERPRRPYEPAILCFNRKAFDALASEGMLDHFPDLTWEMLERRAEVSPLTLRHELEVMDVKAALAPAITTDRCRQVIEFTTWPRLAQFRARPTLADDNGHRRIAEMTVKPDGFIRVEEAEPDGGASEHVFFLEVDRSTEPQGTLATRASCYADYYRRGGLAVRFGHRREEYEDFPFRVLMVFKNQERRNNTAERLLRSPRPIRTQVWLTTFTEVTQTPLAPIWIRPFDYQAAVAGSPYDVERHRPQDTYRRQTGREELVEERARRWALFEEEER